MLQDRDLDLHSSFSQDYDIGVESGVPSLQISHLILESFETWLNHWKTWINLGSFMTDNSVAEAAIHKGSTSFNKNLFELKFRLRIMEMKSE